MDRNDLTTGDMLGSGEFADVYKGTLQRGGKTNDVAVKMLKVGRALEYQSKGRGFKPHSSRSFRTSATHLGPCLEGFLGLSLQTPLTHLIYIA